MRKFKLRRGLPLVMATVIAVTSTGCNSKEAKVEKQTGVFQSESYIQKEDLSSLNQYYQELDKLFQDYIKANNISLSELLKKYPTNIVINGISLDTACAFETLKKMENYEQIIDQIDLIILYYINNLEINDEDFSEFMDFYLASEYKVDVIKFYYELAKEIHLRKCNEKHELKENVFYCPDLIKQYEEYLLKKQNNYEIVTGLTTLEEYLQELDEIYEEYSKKHYQTYQEIITGFPYLDYDSNKNVHESCSYQFIKNSGYSFNYFNRAFDVIIVLKQNERDLISTPDEGLNYLISVIGNDVNVVDYFFDLAFEYHLRTCSCIHKYKLDIYGNRFSNLMCDRLQELKEELIPDEEEKSVLLSKKMKQKYF